MPPLDLRALVDTALSAPPPDPLREQWPRFVELDARRLGVEDVLSAARSLRVANGAGLCVDASMLEPTRRVMQDAAPALIVSLNETQSDDIAAIAAQAGACAGDGAEAVELLVPLTAIEDGDIGLIGDLIEACRTTVGPGVALRVLMPGGAVDASVATAIARTAVMAGVDFLGVATLPDGTPPDLDLAAVLLSVIMEAEGKVGFKASQAHSMPASLPSLAQAILGPEWLKPENMRLEASHLASPFD